VSVRWLEEDSHTTWENAVLSQRLLRQENINHVLVVTHAIHMPRAVWSFERVGMRVTAAPTLSSLNQWPTKPPCWLPGVSGGIESLFHEYLGLLWYRWRY
ncbi:MAG: YdcF family protein, partial [Magnetococcales bacterium]|nr:YdcF family protein [Magnetococcales bacterium]